MFEIKTGIPVPTARAAGRPSNKYPFADMAVGDVFFVPLGEDTAKTVLERLRTNTARWKKVNKHDTIKFRVTAIEDPDTLAPSVGVWRVA